MTLTFYIGDSQADGLSPGAINASIWNQGFAGHAHELSDSSTFNEVIKGTVNIGCVICRLVIASFAVHDVLDAKYTKYLIAAATCDSHRLLSIFGRV